jgi:hypothetical protein
MWRIDWTHRMDGPALDRAQQMATRKVRVRVHGLWGVRGPAEAK